MKVTIYQALNPEFMFRVEEGKKDYRIGDYKIVYETESDFGEATDKEILEHFFEVCNLTHPEGYTGHSLSVGDIVELDDRLYICDSFGWESINWVKD